MVSSLNDSNDPPRASFSQREPQRGLEALSNFYGRFSTDHAPVRSKNTETSLSSYAGSMRRSSSGTEFYSNAQSFNGGDDTSSAPDPSAPQPKSPRVYTSFSAAAAAASRSSLNERSSQASFPNNANASPSIRNSPALSSPRTASSGFADVAATSGGGTASGLVSIPTPAQAKGASFDIAAINQYSPGSLANTFPWLSSNPDAPPKRDRVPHASNSKPLSPQTKADSPPISQYSKGKGFGWNPNKDQATPKSSSKIRSGSGGSQVNSVGRGLGIKSTSELDLPERMRSQRKGAPAPPRLSQDPISLSIEEELKPRSSTSKGDSAFSRFGRAFRRKSKTGSDLKADFSTTARDAPPLPKTPRTASSQALPVKPSDPFAEKALKASSGFVDPALRKPSSSTDVVGQARDLTGVKPTEQTQTSSDMVSGDATSIASGVKPRNGEQTIVPDEPRSTVAASLPVESQQSSAATQEVQGSQANNVENKMHLESTVSDKAQLTTDSSMASVSRDASMTSLQPEQDSSKRPTSMISSTSSANRSSLAFLAPAISMGAIASEIQGSSAEPLDASKDDTAEAVAPAQTNSDATTSPEPSSVSTPLAAPVVTPDADPNSLVHRQPASTEQTASSSSTAIPRKLSGNRSRLEPKSATRNDHIPGILSEFLSMDAELSAREAKLAKGKTPSRSTQDDRSAADISTDSSSAAMERSISCTSEGRRSLSSSPKAVRATKGVYMAPAAGPHMGGFVSPFYVAPITSADSGIMARATRPSGRRASASSRSIHSDDSRSIYSASRRGSVPLAAPEVAAKDEQHQPASVSRVTDDHPDQQPREIDETEKARKIKSFGNLRTAAKDGPPEALPRASTSRLPSPSILLSAGEGRSNGLPTNSPPKSSEPSAATKDLPNALPPHEDSPSRSRSVSNRFVRRPKTSAADLAGERAVATLAHAEGHPRSGPGRASLDSGRSPVPYSSSPTETNFEMLAPRDPLATPTKSRDESLRQRTNLTVEGARPSGLERKSSSSFARRPSEQSVGAITPSSSKIESQGGAGGLFGNPSTRPRTSSLLPSFGFSRGRTGSSAGLEGTGKSPGSFSSSVRTASSGFRRDANESTATQEANGGGQSPRVSSSSRPSFSRQLSTSTGLSDAEAKQLSSKPEKKFSLSAFLPYDDEEAPEYAERIASTAPKAQIAAILASSADVFYVEALHHFMTRFWFNGLPLDIALRKLLMDLHLPKETQQIDRVMEAFAKRYNECNSGLFASDDQPYILSFSLMMLHTDAFNKNAKNKMTKVDYLRNTGASGVPTEILEYLYDNLTFTQFIYVEDEEDGKRRPSEASGMSLSGTSMSTSLGAQSAAASNSRTKLDPYYLITQGRLGELRPDLEDVIPEDTPFSYTGSLPTFDVDRLNSAFLHAPSIEIVTTKTPSEQPGTATPNPLDVEEDVVSLKVTKVGVVNRKDDVSDGGKKAASRKWKTSGLLLTGSQLLLFKDIIWINALQSQILDQVGHSLLCNGIPTDDDAANDIVEGGVIISPRITYFRPDGVISLADAVAVKDHTYGKYDFVFRLLAAKGRQYLVQAQSEDDMNDWIHKINFCASFRTSNIKIRGLDLAPRVGSGADGMERLDAPEDRLGRPDLSRPSFSGSTRRLNADDSGRTTPTADDSGDLSREGTLRLSVDPQSRSSESDVAARPRSSASHRLSPASSAIQKRAKARREMMLTKIAETEVQMERVKARLADEIRLARHFAILTPFLKSTRDRIEMSALPLASRIRALRLEVAKAESRCRILRLDLAAGERVARALLPNTYLSSSAMRAANRVPSAQMGTPQLMELGHVNDSQTQFEELFAPMGPGSNGSSSAYEPASVPASLSGTVNKPASHQRNQMNLNAVSEQPAEESPVLASRRQMSGPDGDDTEEERVREANARLAQKSAAKHAVGGQHTTRGSAADEVPEDWDLSQLARPGTNRISLVDLPSPNELEEATGGRFRFDHRPAEYFE
ncbi:uncharacterized protein SPSC_02382 [Sporisorium scitamineum]|uniref:SEC7 domain-containing protein n=1 Tax=Sporisorium scitamineum TaxID=49012 RepID=A0A0F7S9W9_9BASI|nr:uncharacterized protein SPSC_02382 [Sporisorium scitamineum]CDW97413.1 hypothetical protein [Sporisorium scitamineum]